MIMCRRTQLDSYRGLLSQMGSFPWNNASHFQRATPAPVAMAENGTSLILSFSPFCTFPVAFGQPLRRSNHAVPHSAGESGWLLRAS